MRKHPLTGRPLLLGDLFVNPATGTRFVWCGNRIGWIKQTKKGA